jgi:hypothetical protein
LKFLSQRPRRSEWLACLGAISVLLPVCTRADNPNVDAEFLEYLGGLETSTTNWTDVTAVKPAQSVNEKPANLAPPANADKGETTDTASRSSSSSAQPEKS